MRRFVILMIAGILGGCAAETPKPTTSDGLAILKRVPPLYPRAAAEKGVEGCVVVSFEVRPDGGADNYQILDSQPKGVFDNATLHALSQWRFETPTEGRHAQVLTYKLDNSKNPEPKCIAPPSSESLNREGAGKS